MPQGLSLDNDHFSVKTLHEKERRDTEQERERERETLLRTGNNVHVWDEWSDHVLITHHNTACHDAHRHIFSRNIICLVTYASSCPWEWCSLNKTLYLLLWWHADLCEALSPPTHTSHITPVYLQLTLRLWNFSRLHSPNVYVDKCAHSSERIRGERFSPAHHWSFCAMLHVLSTSRTGSLLRNGGVE